jgi:hypothetical protein
MSGVTSSSTRTLPSYLRERVGTRARRLIEQRVNRRQVATAKHINCRSPDDRRVHLQQTHGRRIHRADAPGGVDGHHTGGHTLDDGLDISPPAVHLPVLALEIHRRPLETAAARGQLRRHRVERFDHRAELVRRLMLDALVVTTLRDLTRGH